MLPQTHYQRREYCPEGDCGVDWEPKLPTAGALITGERPALADVGTWLKRTLKQRFAQADRATGEEPIQLSVKYIDPVRACVCGYILSKLDLGRSHGRWWKGPPCLQTTIQTPDASLLVMV